MRKNCENCIYMEWGEGDVNDPSGWICTRKDFYGTEESNMIYNMSRKSYRLKGKVCFQPLEDGNKIDTSWSSNEMMELENQSE